MSMTTFEDLWTQQGRLKLFHAESGEEWNKIFAKYLWNYRASELKESLIRIDELKATVALHKRQQENNKGLMLQAELRIKAYETLLREILDNLEDIFDMQESQSWASSAVATKVLMERLDKIVLLPKTNDRHEG